MEQKEDLLQQLASALRSPRGRYAKENTWQLLQKRIPALAPSARRRAPYVRPLRITAAAVAAAALLLVVLRFTVWQASTPVAPVTVSTLAETRTILLPDSSVVTLNRYSTLTYPERFDNGMREVHLQGEAYFDVHKDAEHPFRVIAEELAVRVLGTRFNVEAYSDDPQVSATLIEGSVSVIPDGERGQSMILSPNERAVYHRDNRSLQRQSVADAADDARWREGMLLFRNQPLEEIARQLSHTFHLTIRTEDAGLRQYRMTATFSDRDTPEEILTLLCRGRNMEWVRQPDGTMLIRPLRP
ncbi:MAG: FecR domain-containing protein [Prevotellaceae bacterium]|jgi:ferric-dicitrate binding protein FerR (iron transport regulator)|nr:FecR domain-containing protein [Prevotellaceae bacterium]